MIRYFYTFHAVGEDLRSEGRDDSAARSGNKEEPEIDTIAGCMMSLASTRPPLPKNPRRMLHSSF